MKRGEKVQRALFRQLIKPALRFCLRTSLGYGVVSEEVKSVLVELAGYEIARKKKKISVSRLSLMTGISRREVDRIYSEDEHRAPAPNLIDRVLGQWEQDPRFLTKAGKPKVLSWKGDRSEFKHLVFSVSKEYNPSSMLFELERIGAVERVADGVKLIRVVQEFHDDPEKGLDLLARDTETLIEAVEENMFASREPMNLHLRTEYDNVFKTDLPQLRSWVLTEGILFHKRLRDYLSKFDKDINPQFEKEGGAKIVVTAFSWTSSDESR